MSTPTYDSAIPTNTSAALNPPWLNHGDNAWQLTAASLVGLQSVPGLVVLYAGIVKKKWAVNSAFMAFYAFAAVLICWVVFAYQASFGKQMLPFVGVPRPVLVMNDELRQAILPTSGTMPNFPLSTMGISFYVYCCFYQC
jgi:ammonium transporter, Amt family